MSDQDTEPRDKDWDEDHPREDDRNDVEEGSPIPDPEEEQGDAEDVPQAD